MNIFKIAHSKQIIFLTGLMMFCFKTHALDITKKSQAFRFAKQLKWSKEESNVATYWQMGLGARHFERDSDTSTVFESRGTGNLQLRFLDNLTFYGTFTALFQTGRSQSRYGDLSPDSGVYVNDAYVNWTPFFNNFKQFTFEVGALNQGRTVGSRVLLKNTAFPGVSEVLSFQLNNVVKVKFRAQQLIPYSQTQENELVEKESTPTLQTQSVKVSAKDKRYKLALTAGLFNYSNLPSQVAESSRILGNSVTGNNLNAKFLYDFKGWFAEASLDFVLFNKILVESDLHLVENTEAAEKFNRGHDFGMAIRYKSKKALFGPHFGVFSLEPDVAPAFYNSSSIGNNNRDGWYAGALIDLSKKKNFRLKIKYVKSDLLNRNLNVFQEDQEHIQLSIMTQFKKVVW